MVAILFILMVVILLTAEYLSFSKKISAESSATVKAGLPVATETVERYFHRGHMWALVQPSCDVIAGVDDFSQRFIGNINNIELPQAGSIIRQGEVLATLKHGDKSLPAIAPISGTIVAINKHLAGTPSIVNNSPLERGWIAKIAPQNLGVELKGLFKGVTADRWQEATRAHLVHWFSPRLGIVMQDGGEIIDSVSDMTSSAEWRILIEEFFPNNDQSTLNT
ncbi:MAG TPA: glycine cleavage system protein H [Bacteroidota bacterium]|nr:glycine cleavage system protein H [Bacteroidota bacterium]